MNYSIADVEGARTVEEAATVADLIRERIVQMDADAAGKAFDASAQEEWATLNDLFAKAQARQREFEMRRKRIAELAEAGGAQPIAMEPRPVPTLIRSNLPQDVFALEEYRKRSTSEESQTALLVDGARKAIDMAVFPHERADESKTKARLHSLLAKIDDPGALARHILGTGSPLYSRAFGRALATDGKGLTPEMRAGIATVGTTTTGGYAVPYTLDPSLILTSDGAVNPFRQIARVITITGNNWRGLTSAGISVSRGAEAAAVTESSVAFGQPDITVRAVKAEIKFSIESDEDWPTLQSEMARVLQDARDTEEATSYVTANGSPPAPEGIVGALDASSQVGTGGDGLSLDDVNRLIGRLPDRFEPRARFLAHRAVYLELERLDRATGSSPAYRPLGQGEAPALMGYPRHNSSGMESDFTTATNAILVFGDFSYYAIVDKVGLSIEIDPHVRDGDGKWTGQRAMLAHWRNNTGIITDNAFRVLIVGVVTS